MIIACRKDKYLIPIFRTDTGIIDCGILDLKHIFFKDQRIR